jgi:hypothetical protein
VKLWTLLHQVCAVLLRAGVGEIQASRLVSGLLGMLSLQALAMVTFAFSGRAILSAGLAVLLFVSGVTYAGAVYPIFLMGVPFTYGVVGLSLLVLVAGTLGRACTARAPSCSASHPRSTPGSPSGSGSSSPSCWRSSAGLGFLAGHGARSSRGSPSRRRATPSTP